MRFPVLSIRLIVPLFVIVTTAAMSIAMSRHLSSESRAFLYQRAESNANSLADFYLHVLEAFRGDFFSSENERKMQRIAENIGVLPGVEEAYVISSELKVIARSDRSKIDSSLPLHLIAPVMTLLQTGQPHGQLVVEVGGRPHLLLLRPIFGGTGVLAVGAVVVDLSQEDKQAAAYTDRVMAYQNTAGVIIAVLIFLFVSWRVLRPLAAIGRTVEALGRSDLSSRVASIHDDELGRVAAALNTTLDRLQGEMVSRAELEKVHTELVRSQESMVQSSKMASLGEMASGMAHEINNPVAIIYGRALQLREMIEQEPISRDDLVRVTDKISATALRVAKIVRSLKTFAREGTSDPFVPVPVEKLINETLEFCQERLRHRGVELQVAPIESQWQLSCRQVQLSQVMLNLLNNSVDALEGAAEKSVQISFHTASNKIQILVTDSGPGIPLEMRDKIMQPFFTTKEVGKGTGLGLSVSKGIVESHGGRLFLDSESTKTCFIVELPLFTSLTLVESNAASVQADAASATESASASQTRRAA